LNKEKKPKEAEVKAAKPQPAKKAEKKKEHKGQGGGEKARKATKAVVGGGDDDMTVFIKEKPTKMWNIFITLFFVALTGLLLFSKFQQEKFQKMNRYNRGDTPQEVRE